MVHPNWWPKASRLLRDLVIGIVPVATALLLAHWLDVYLKSAPVSLLLCAIMASGWFGGMRSGLTAVAMSLLAFDYYFVPPLSSFAITANEVPRTIVFTLAALFVGLLSGAQRGTTVALKRLRDDLIAENHDRRLAEEALRDAQSELARVTRLTTMGELAASIAHELRQPLAALVMNGSAVVRWLNRDQPELDEARAAASRIVREADRADEVIRGLLALARNSGPQLTRLDIDDAIQEVLALTRSEVRRHGVVLHTELGAGDRLVMGDRVQLQQVLLNLIVNGIDAMRAVTDRPKELTVSSGPGDAGSVMVSVEDTGTGVDPALSLRIFEPFVTTKADGLGMGLSICRSIIQAHGGGLRVSSRVPHGTALRFTLPIAVDS